MDEIEKWFGNVFVSLFVHSLLLPSGVDFLLLWSFVRGRENSIVYNWRLISLREERERECISRMLFSFLSLCSPSSFVFLRFRSDISCPCVVTFTMQDVNFNLTALPSCWTKTKSSRRDLVSFYSWLPSFSVCARYAWSHPVTHFRPFVVVRAFQSNKWTSEILSLAFFSVSMSRKAPCRTDRSWSMPLFTHTLPDFLWAFENKRCSLDTISSLGVG